MHKLNILISSAGRRLELIQCFRNAIWAVGASGRVHVADCAVNAPSFHLVKQSWQVPRASDPDFISAVLSLSVRENISLIVPTNDSELSVYADSRHLFARHGICICISDLPTIEVSADKIATHKWLATHQFPTVRQGTPEDVLDDLSSWEFPLIVKPRSGSASKGVRQIRSRDELAVIGRLEDNLIVQEIAAGIEHTINVYVNTEGRCVCSVPHERVEVRSGEVSKAVTVKHSGLMSLASSIAETLPGARGPMNIQCFLAPTGDIRVIEINPRFGGGYPLAHHSGARFTHWILEELITGRPAPAYADWTDDLAFLRYDQAVYMPGSKLRARDENLAVHRAGS